MTKVLCEIADVMGRTKKMQIIFDDAVPVEDIQASYTAFETDFHAASGAAIISAVMSKALTISGETADAGSNVDEMFLVTCTMVTGRKHTFEFACPKKTAGVFDFITSTGAVNVADTQVTDLIANWLAAGDAVVGEDAQRSVSAILSGYLQK